VSKDKVIFRLEMLKKPKWMQYDKD